MLTLRPGKQSCSRRSKEKQAVAHVSGARSGKSPPRSFFDSIAIKKLFYSPEKVSDLEEAAKRMAALRTTGKVVAGSAILGATSGFRFRNQRSEPLPFGIT